MTRPTTEFALGELMRRAMTAAYGMIARESVASFEATAAIEALVDVLVAKGLIDPAEFAAARERAEERLAEERAPEWTGPSLAIVDGDVEPTTLDCEARHARCQSACCVFFKIALTEDEVRGGALLWDLGAPYELPRGPDGHCLNLDRETLQCSVWDRRPVVCRHYTCAEDREIWDDFEAMIPTERVVALSRIRATRAR